MFKKEIDQFLEDKKAEKKPQVIFIKRISEKDFNNEKED